MDQKARILNEEELCQIITNSSIPRIKIDEDLYYILVEKTKRGGEAAQRVTTVQPGQGIHDHCNSFSEG